MKRAVMCVLALGCLISLQAQSPIPPSPLGVNSNELLDAGKSVRLAFEHLYPPDRTYAVVVRPDLPTISVKARESG